MFFGSLWLIAPLHARDGAGAVLGERRACVLGRRILLERLHHDLDRFLQLRVFALAHGLGVELDLDVRADADVLGYPLAPAAPARRRVS